MYQLFMCDTHYIQYTLCNTHCVSNWVIKSHLEIPKDIMKFKFR